MQVVRNTNLALKSKSNGRLDCLLQSPFEIFIIHPLNQIISKDVTSTKRKQTQGSKGILNLLRSSLTCKSNALEFTQLSQVIGRCCQVTPKNSRRCESASPQQHHHHHSVSARIPRCGPPRKGSLTPNLPARGRTPTAKNDATLTQSAWVGS